jgi:BirA family transcriptional regulator, biotin operon repressor / biotin---[acetyl-CoA-carboxylase] ligase
MIRIGRPHRHFRTVGSTNEVARGLAAAGAPAGTLVTSEEQTAGRGRQGRNWSTPAGAALAWSLVLRRRAEVPGTLPLQVGVGVCEAVESLGVPEAGVKWPNDVWIEGRKCAGILVEARLQEGWIVVGVGLNLSIPEEGFPEELRERAVSVGNGATIRSATAALNHCVGARLDAPVAGTLAEVSRRDVLCGRTIRWDGGDGVADGIDNAGNLVVAKPDGGREALSAGEVHLELTR